MSALALFNVHNEKIPAMAANPALVFAPQLASSAYLCAEMPFRRINRLLLQAIYGKPTHDIWVSVHGICESFKIPFDKPALSPEWMYGRSKSSGKMCFETQEYRVELRSSSKKPVAVLDKKREYAPVIDAELRLAILKQFSDCFSSEEWAPEKASQSYCTIC